MQTETQKPTRGAGRAVNLFDLKPERRREWERDAATQMAVVLVPRFQGKILGKLLQPRLRNPFYKINLDEYGTAVWEACDGNTSVQDIAGQLRQRFGDKIEPLNERLSVFLRQLEQSGLIRFNNLNDLRRLSASA